MHGRPNCSQQAVALGAALLILAAGSAGAWETVLPFSDYTVDVPRLFVADDGDVSMVANFDEATHSGTMVASLRGVDGETQWRMSPDLDRGGGSENRIYDAVQAAHGDVIATGFIGGSELFHDIVPVFVVFRVDQGTGTIRWQTDLGDGRGLAIALDQHGDVVVSGSDSLAKLSGATGEILWLRRGLDYNPYSRPVAVDRSGDVLVGQPGAVEKYDGRRGAFLWRQPAASWSVNKIHPVSGVHVVTVECDAAPPPGGFTTHIVMRRGADGTERWRYAADTSLTGGCGTQAVVTRDHGIVLARVGDDGAWIARLDRHDGSPRWRYPLSVPDSFPRLLGLLPGAMRDEVVVHSWASLSGFDGRGGHERWKLTFDHWPYRAAPVDSDHMVVAAQAELGNGILVEKVSVDRSARGDRGRRRGMHSRRGRLDRKSKASGS